MEGWIGDRVGVEEKEEEERGVETEETQSGGE